MTGAIALDAPGWLLASLGLALIGWPPVAVGGSRRSRVGRGGARMSRLSASRLACVAALATAGLCVLLGGARSGGLLAVVLAPAAAVAARRLASRPARAGPDPALPLALDLAAAALRTGRPVPVALRLAAPCLPGGLGDQWHRVASLLALGADPGQAWAVLADDPALASLAATARRSADSGARLARLLTQLAEDTRAELRSAAVARAERVGVLAMAPLGLCFLPAFVCLGIVPTIVGIARGVIPGLI